MKFLKFYLFLWVLFALLDPDPDPTDLNKCESEKMLVTYFFVKFRSCGSVIHTILVF
jgi:hypothetical protein